MEPQRIQPDITPPQQGPAMPPPEPMAPMQSPMPEINTMPPKSGGKAWMVIAILMTIALIAVSAFGYTKWQAYRTKVGDLGSQVNALQAQVTELQAAATTASLAKITELGIQFAKPTDAIDAFYFVSKNTEGNQVASFSSPALQVLAALNPSTPAVTNACGLNSAPLGTVTQVKAGTLIKGVKVEEVKDTDLLIVKKQDVNYYLYNAPTAQCSTVKVVQDLQAKQAKSLQETFTKNLTVLVQ